jgi:hypothetical protein
MPASLFVAGYKKIGFAWYLLVFGTALGLRGTASFHLPASAPVGRGGNMPSSLFVAGYKKIGFAWHFFRDRSWVSAVRPLSIYPPAHPLAVGG